MLGKAYVPYLLALEGREVSGQWIQRGSVQAVGVFDALIPRVSPSLSARKRSCRTAHL